MFLLLSHIWYLYFECFPYGYNRPHQLFSFKKKAHHVSSCITFNAELCLTYLRLIPKAAMPYPVVCSMTVYEPFNFTFL